MQLKGSIMIPQIKKERSDIMSKKKNEKQVVELLKTMKEGVSYLDKKFSQGKVEDKLYMFFNLMEAFTAVEDTLNKYGKVEVFKEKTDELRNAFDVITSSYEKDNPGDVRSYFVFSFKKAFDEWYKQIMKEYQ